MILLILFAVAALIFGYIAGDESYPFSWGNFIGTIIVTALLYLGLIGFIRLLRTDSTKFYTYEYKDQEIQSLVNKTGVASSGSFILGCGSVSGRSYDYYISYAQFPQGALRIKVSAFRTYVKETNSESPKIINYWIRKVNKAYKSPWIWNRKERVGDWKENDNYYGGADLIVIVPEKTIYKEFKIED
jgi:hypothetical protein